MYFKLLLVLSATLLLALGVACGEDDGVATPGTDSETAAETQPASDSEADSAASAVEEKYCFPPQLEGADFESSLIEVTDVSDDSVTLNVMHPEQQLEGLVLPKDQLQAHMEWQIGEFRYGLEYLPIAVGFKGYELLPICSGDKPEVSLFVNTELYCPEAGSQWVEAIRQRIQGAKWIPNPCAPVEIPTVTPH
jgi:hypothetical protein